MSDPGSRLLRLLGLLGARPWATAQDLADRLEVTTRTVRRDITRLRDLGYPVDSLAGPGGGYGFGRGGRLPPLVLDEGEAVAVAIGLRLVGRASVTGAEDAAEVASTKLEQLLSPTAAARVDAVVGSMLVLDAAREAVDADLLGRIAAAAHARHQLRLRYRDRAGTPSDRLIAPYRLVHTRGRWYLVAHDPAQGEWRTFRVDRVDGVTLTGRPAVLIDPPDALDHVARSVSTAPYRHQARVRVHADAARVSERVPPDVGVVEAAAGGACTLTTGGDHLDAIAGHLVMLGLPFTVLDPPELIAHMAEVGRRLAASHSQI